VSLSDIVNVQIRAASAAITRAGFGTPLIAACRVPWEAEAPAELVRTYSSISGMESDGFIASDPAHRAASAIFAQQPRVQRVKVGKRASARWFTHVVALTPASPALGTLYSIEIDGDLCEYTASGSDTLADVCTNFAAAIDTAAGDVDVDAIITTRASSASLQTIITTGLNGVVGQGAMDPPRSLAFVFNSHADWDATTAVVTGTDSAGNTISENFAIPNGGNATVSGTKLFRKVTQVVIPAQTGTNGTFTLGKRSRLDAASAGAGTRVDVTATDTGMLIPYAARSASLALHDTTTNPGIATDLGAINGADVDWYGLLIDSNSELEVEAAAGWAESNDKLFGAQSADTACADSGSTTDVAADLQTSNYFRSPAFFHPDIGTTTSWLAAGMFGDRLPADPGSDTWKFKTVAGVSSYVLSETEKTNLHAKNMFTYTVIAGVAVTEQGKVPAGEWVDVVRGIDWLKARMRERVFGLLVGAEKVPYTDAGVDLVAAQVRAQLRQGVSVELLAPGIPGSTTDPPPVVTAPLVADVDPVDRANRVLPDVEFSARLAGAIHAVQINGTVSE
jgi:hypothetical protein